MILSLATRNIAACPMLIARALEFVRHSAGAAANLCAPKRNLYRHAKSTRMSKLSSIGFKKVKRNAHPIMIARAPACAKWTTTMCARAMIKFACEIEVNT